MTSFLLVLFWLLVPPLILLAGTAIRPPLYFWIEPVNNWLVDLSPLGPWARTVRVRPGPTVYPGFEEFAWTMGLQLGGAGLFLLLAIWRLRPIFRRQEETSVRRPWFRSRKGRRRRRWFAPPACGDDPIVWKERYFAPVDRFTRIVLLPAIVVITLPLALMTEVEGRLSGIAVDFWRLGLAAREFIRNEFLWALQVDLGWYVGFWLLAVAGAAASAVTMEREKDTWISLTTTPLTGSEILRGKVMGAIWNQRGFAAVLVFLWAMGFVTGAAHPLGILASITAVGLLTWLVAMVGVLRVATRLEHVPGDGLVSGRPVGFERLSDPRVPLVYRGGRLGVVLPRPGRLAVAGRLVDVLAQDGPTSIGDRDDLGWPLARRWTPVGFGLILVLIYAVTALALTWRIVRRFDRWLDRPPLTKESRPHPSSTPILKEAAVG